jgi:transcriptional regulator with XRE-family HTH domain
MATVQQWTGAEATVLRQAMRLSVRAFAARLGVDARTVNKWEARGRDITPLPDTQSILDTALSQADEEVQARFAQAMAGQPRLSEAQRIVPAHGHFGHEAERLRRSLQDQFAGGAVSKTTVDDWELTVARYGTATKDRPASVLLGDLISDVAELDRAMAQCRSLSSLRRLTRVAANLSGLMCLTLIKLDDRQAFRRWARTARIAATEADDAVTYSWVLAQEAYGHFYSDDPTEAVSVAQHAQAVVPTTPCVGAALAAALEARAQAALGRADETQAALRQAEALVSGLGMETAEPSAFTYNEAQLRFHESNALTHLGATKAAWLAQDRALELVAPSDFMDRSFTHLDRAMCLAVEGDASGASAHARDTLLRLSTAERQGIISGRAQQIIHALPSRQRVLSPVQDLYDLLMVDPQKEGV